MSINGKAQSPYTPTNSNGYDTLSSSATKEFCVGGTFNNSVKMPI